MKCTYSCIRPSTRSHGGVPGRAGGHGGRVGGRGPGSSRARSRPLSSKASRSGSSSSTCTAGLSQLESWDPKPGTDTGGPFRAIETSVPGIQISELLPNAPSRCTTSPGPRRQHERGRPRQGRLHDAHRPAADAGRRLPAPRRRLRQGLAPEDSALARPHRHHARRRRRPRQRRRLPRPQVLEHRTWATASPPQNTTRPGQVTESMDAARNDVPPARQRPVPEPPPHGRHRGLHLLLRAGRSSS